VSETAIHMSCQVARSSSGEPATLYSLSQRRRLLGAWSHTAQVVVPWQQPLLNMGTVLDAPVQQRSAGDLHFMEAGSAGCWPARQAGWGVQAVPCHPSWDPPSPPLFLLPPAHLPPQLAGMLAAPMLQGTMPAQLHWRPSCVGCGRTS
jgi:hypothetical protein